jgi:dihydropteroate synthase
MAEPGASALRRLLPDLGKRTAVMGIVNATPDSFSDGGDLLDPARAIQRAVEMFAAGAELVDVGGESTRPGAAEVSAEEELARVLPVIEGLSALGLEGISVDTTKAVVARRAVEAGARLVNDVSGLTFDPEMARTVAELQVPVVLGHTRGRPRVMQQGEPTYQPDVVTAVKAALAAGLEALEVAGLARSMVLVDPGIGFGKTLAQNLALLGGLRELAALGCPVLVGTSRKAFLGALTGREVGARGYATAASVALSVANGADVVRVHDVEATLDVVKVADAMVRGSLTC